MYQSVKLLPDEGFFDFVNRHALSVNGKFSAITERDLLTVGDRFGIGNAGKILSEMKKELKG